MTPTKTTLFASILILLTSGVYIYISLPNPLTNAFNYALIGILAGIALLLASLALRFKRKGRDVKFKIVSAITLLWLIASTISIYDYRTFTFPGAGKALSVAQWESDIDWLEKQVKQQHPAMAQGEKAKALSKAVTNLKASLSDLSDQTIRLEIMKLIALIGEGHSIVPPQPAINVSMLPVVIQKFGDSFAISNAAPNLKGLIGSEILSINEIPIVQVTSKLSGFYAMENPEAGIHILPLYLSNADLLKHVGVVDNIRRISITTKNSNGESVTTKIKSRNWIKWALLFFYPDGETRSDQLADKLQPTNYWIENDKVESTLWVNITTIKNNSSGPTLQEFSNIIREELNAPETDRLVIDLRRNRGGDNYLMRDLAFMLSEHPKLQQQGSLKVLISGKTYSAAVNFASLLENMTPAIFIGQGTGQGATHYGEAELLKMPNSKIYVNVSTKKWAGNIDALPETEIQPHIDQAYTLSDYQEGKDPVRDLITEHSIANPVEASHALPEDLVGEYFLDNHFRVSITKNNNDTWMTVANSYPNSLQRVKTQLFAQADNTVKTTVRRITLEQGTHGNWIFNSGPRSYAMVSAEPNQLTPAEMILQGQVSEGKDLIVRQDEFDDMDIETELIDTGFWFLWDGNRPEDALNTHALALALYPDSPDSNNAYGQSLVHHNKIDEAKVFLAKAISLNPEMQWAIDTLAKINAGEWFNE